MPGLALRWVLNAFALWPVSFFLNVFINDRGRVGHIYVEYRRL